MNFKSEWDQRFRIWMDELPKYFYEPLGAVEFEGFTTFEHLTPQNALAHSFFSMAPETLWGRKWEYGWFRGKVTLPLEVKGQRIVLRPEIGGEALVWVNGQAAGTIDREHREILLTPESRGGETYQILAESYAGHGPRLENGVPCPPGTITIAEPPLYQVQVDTSTFGIWNEDAFQLWMDWQTLMQLRDCLEQRSLRWQKIDKALRKAALVIDFERNSAAARNATFREARRILSSELACHNGSTAPVMYTFGQSHLDLAWLWPWQETRRKSARTVSNQLALLEEYPQYRFMWCEPPLYQALEESYPDVYRRVKEKMEEGRIFADGAVWVESDTNLPSGESLIRQILYGRRFYKEKLNTDSRTVWLPDCFGFSASLPQIMKGCGVRYFATQKIIRNYNGGDPFPYNIFLWEGIDGTRILSHIFKKNNALLDPATVITRWNEDRNQQEDIEKFLFPFGHGDGGGGATRSHVEFLRRMEDLEGVPRMRISTLDGFFHDIEQDEIENRYVGELYFQCHRGTYTSQARLKQKNRQSEWMLRETELWSSLAGCCDVKRMESLWKNVLFNQFHDVVTGVSIHRVCEEAEAAYDEVLKDCDELTNKAKAVLTSGEQLTVWNSLSWPRNAQVLLPEGCTGATDDKGNLLPSQHVENGVAVELELPACGYRSIWPVAMQDDCREELPLREFVLENEYVRITVNEEGQLESVWDLEGNRELLRSPGNVFRMYRDTPVKYEAWDIDHVYPQMEIHPETETVVSWLEYGKLCKTIRVQKKFSSSTMVQDIILRRGSKCVEFDTTVDWNEHHKLLRTDFPFAIQTVEAIHEIQFGFVKRPTHRSRQYDKDRFEVVNHKYTALSEENWGVAVLNDCKYGVSAEDGVISLALLRSPKVPDMYADVGTHHFSYAVTFWNQTFFECNVVREGYELNVLPSITCGSGSKSFLQISAPSVILDCMKTAEDGSGDIVLRLYESKHSSVPCDLTINFDGYEKAVEADMSENLLQELLLESGTVHLQFKPFEIKTIRLIKKLKV